jgi:hypothetical protein
MNRNLILLVYFALVPALVCRCVAEEGRPREVVEISGRPGTFIQVGVTPPAAAKRLWLRTSNLKFASQAAVSINGGAAIALNNSSCAMTGLGAQLSGIGGPLDTLTFVVKNGEIQPGVSNSLSFQIRATPQATVSAFRILEINFADETGALLWSNQPPVAVALGGFGAAPAIVGAGSNLWFHGRLISQWGGTNVSSHCADCHAYDGSDLAYFGYSDQTIRSRSEMHGLKPAECDAVLAYIRSLPVTNYGAPWNPPFQPGPGLDSRPAAAWPAGAGIDAVLADDRGTFDAWFHGKDPTFDFSATLNMRELPVSMPMPSWNEWLPAIDPAEYYGADFAEIYDVYHKMRESASVQDLMLWFGIWSAKWADFQTGGRLNAHYRRGNTTDQLAWYSARRWQLVKQWEILQANGWWDKGREMFPDYPEAVERIFPGNALFQTAPHFTVSDQNRNCLRDSARPNWSYLSDQWYWVQLVVNDAQHHRYGTSPIDWPYLLAFATTPLKYRIPAAAQIFAALTKAGESGVDGPGVTSPPRRRDEAFSPYDATRTEYLMLREFPEAWRPYPKEWRNKLFHAWLTEYERRIRGFGRDYFVKTTLEIAGDEAENKPCAPNAGPWVAEHAAFLDWLKRNDVAPESLKMMLALARDFWPKANWDRFEPQPLKTQ